MHLKSTLIRGRTQTNIHKDSNIMFRILVEGYNFGKAAVINSDICGYATVYSSEILNPQINNYANGVSLGYYYDIDGYLVIALNDVVNSYYMGFSLSAWFTNPHFSQIIGY